VDEMELFSLYGDQTDHFHIICNILIIMFLCSLCVILFVVTSLLQVEVIYQLLVVLWSMKEKERRQRSRLSVRSESRLKTFSHHRNSDNDDDDDNLPPGGMTGGFGSFHNGPRVIF